MLRTKKDVDKHVRSTLSKLREDEKNLRGHRIATLYYNIGEYSSALEYIQRYIQANDKNPEAYKIQGQCYEKLKRPDKQLYAYQRSLELDKKQTDLLIEVCKLMQSNEVPDVTPAKARYWYELAESRNVHDSAVLNLKLKFSSGDQSGIQDIILKEIARRPFDIGLRIRLVYYFLDQNRIDDAFKYVSDLQLKPNTKFRNSIDWNSTVSHVLDKYKEKNASTISKNWPYWLQRITSIERQLFLTLMQSPKDSKAIDRNLFEATDLLFELDQNLNKVATACSFPESERDLASEFVLHFRGQLGLHAASLLFKRQAEQLFHGNWSETTKSALPLLLFAYNFGAIDANQLWLRNASEVTKQLIELWQAQSSFRVAQAARTLHSCITASASNDNAMLENLRRICTDKYNVWSSPDDVLKEIRSIVADSDWRKKLYRTLFNSKDKQMAVSGSYLVKSSAFESPTFEWPDVQTLATLEIKSQEADPSNLAHLVYLALGHDFVNTAKQITIDPDFKCILFKNLNLSVANLMNCGAETLNQIDVDAFLYAATLQAKRNITLENTMTTGASVSDANKPKILPYTNMASCLCTGEQSEWWTAAYKIYNNIAGDELAELRATLQFGIEAVRGVGSPKMDLIILLKLGQIFSKKAQKTTKSVERGYLEDRSDAIFKLALDMFRKKTNSRSSEAFRRLFKYVEGSSFFEIQQEEKSLAEEAITFLAGRYFSKNAFEECADELAGIKLPFATYFTAESYRKMIENADTPKKNKRAFLDKAKDYFKETLDLLDSPSVDKNHPLKSIVDEDLKRLHNETRKLETNQSMSDSFVSANGRSDLEDSHVHRYERDIDNATPVPQSGYDNIERLIRQMMESLNILKEDVSEVRNRVQNIEEQLNKDDIDVDDADNLDDYYLDDMRNQSHNLNSTSMVANVSRNQTLNQQTPKTSQMPKGLPMNAQQPMSAYSHQSPMAMSNAYNMNPMLNTMYGQMPMNPYQTALANAAGQSYNQTTPIGSNFSQTPLHPYGNDVIATLQQQILAQHLVNDSRNPALMGLLQQQNQVPPQFAQHSYAMTNPLSSLATGTMTSTMSPAEPSLVNAQQKFDSNASPMMQMPSQKQWNASIKNTPVEKGLPVNVVITTSDPLPQNITTMSTASSTNFSVTIPPQHMKNNSAAVPTSTVFGAALSNPSIVAALQDKKTTPSPSKPNATAVKTVTSTATVPTTQEQKFIFGNLSKPASSTPISSPGPKSIADTSKTETPKTEVTKPSPFASFSFGMQSMSVSPATSSQSKPLFSFSNIGQSLNKTETSSSLANAATPETPLQKDANANTSASSVRGEDDDNRNFEPSAHFEPVIPLPDLVEVKTGEENETVLFVHRAKLLRFVKETKEWKERGIGDIKIMANKDDPNKVRLLMRRDQVLKICCNQMLTKDTKFNKMPNTETALTWFGQDYSENELQVQMLAIRFKTAEVCKQFHDAILTAQAKMSDGNIQPTKETSVKPTTTTADKPSTETKGFGDQFKPKTGSWSCEICYVVNKATDKKCLSCGEVKDKNAPPEESSKPAAPAPLFSFGNLAAAKAAPSTTEKPAAAKTSLAEQFKPKPGSWTCQSCYTANTAPTQYCVCCEAPKDDTVPKKEKANIFGSNAGAPKFSFGNLGAATQNSTAPVSNTISTASTASTGSASFGSPAFSFSFGSQNATNSPSTSKPDEPPVPKLGETKDFGFVFKGKSPMKQPPAPAVNSNMNANAHADGVEDVSDDENVEEEENTAYFAPVIPLPDKVEVKTGEEDEDVLYSHRAKLFRYREKEWRERGLGDVRILRHKQTGQLRVLMRREQIHKICLNHLLTPEVEYTVKDPKSWQFIANDYSDGTFEVDNFCLRFKTDEIAKEFKKAIDDIRCGNETTKVNGTTSEHTPIASNVTDEERKNISDLQLPGNFYDYKTHEQCTGCRGCASDDYVFSEVKDTNLGQTDDNPLPLNPPPKVNTSHNDLSKDTKKTTPAMPFSFGSFKSEGNGFDLNTTSNADSKKESGMLFGNSSFKSIFSPGNDAKDANNTASPAFGQTNLFGGNVTKTPSSETVKSTPSFSFNQAPVFGSNATEEKSTFSFATALNKPQDKAESTPIFGSAASFGSTNVMKTPTSNLFGGNTNGDNKPNETSSGGFSFKLPSSTTVTPISMTESTQQTPTQTSTPTTEQPTEQKPVASIFGSSGMSFADLAKNSSNGSSSFGQTTTTGGFIGLSNRDTFSNLMQPQNATNGSTPNAQKDDDNENAGDDANYDPHYEPIIALPDEVQVSTGEENEDKLFGERAKLYRFDSDNKEWKERGVGEFKILHHPGNDSYRLLLRREQIHKLVLNMALTGDLKITPMKQSDKAFIWVGQNYAENSADGEIESLSVRFKNADLATQFNDIVQKCIEKLKVRT